MRNLTWLLLSSCLLASCDNGNDDETDNSKTHHITMATWKYESGGVDQDRNGTTDVSFESTGLLQSCTLDNTGKFNADGSGVADEGATKCNASLPQTTPFTWSFASNETLLNVGGAGLLGLNGQFKIRELTADKFSLSKDSTVTFPGLPPVTVSLIVNLKH